MRIIDHSDVPQHDPKLLRKKRRQTANVTGCGCGCFSLMLGSGVIHLTQRLLLPGIPVWLLLIPLCALLVRKTGKCKPLLWFMRAAGVLLLLLHCKLTLLCVSFPTVPALYRVRRFLYREGVRDRSHSAVLMPERLPEQFTGYTFRACVQAPAQDYYPDASLHLRTDAEWLRHSEDTLAAESGLMRLEDTQPEILYDEEDDEQAEPLRPKYLPLYLFDTDYITEDLQHAVFYLPQNADGTPDSYAGAMINYETGLLIVWI